MRRSLALVVVAAASVASLAPAASARPPLPCDYWVHGCNVAQYVQDVCDRDTTLDCGIV